MTRAPWTRENDTAATPTPANTSRRAKVVSVRLDMGSCVVRSGIIIMGPFTVGFLTMSAVLSAVAVSNPSPGQVALEWEAQQFANTCASALIRVFTACHVVPKR
jgi:hypothetical protein